MNRLLSFEFRRLLKSKAFLICIIVGSVLSVLGVAIAKYTSDMLNSFGGGLGVELDGLTNGYSGIKFLVQAGGDSDTTIFFAIFITIFVCADFSEGTIKNILSRGFSREQVFVAKSLVMIVAGVIFGLINMLVSFLAGSIAFGIGTGFSLKLIGILLLQLLGLISYVMFDVLLAVLFTKAGGAMTLGIIIPMLTPILGQLGDLAICGIFEDLEFGGDYVSRYFVSTNLSYISKLNPDGKTLAFASVIFCIYIIIFTLLGYLAIRKKEV